MNQIVWTKHTEKLGEPKNFREKKESFW
jgi:hypothetical protein